VSHLDALQGALAAEHAALFVTGFLGAQTSQSATPALYETFRASYDAHRARRDDLVAMVRGAGEEPVAAEPSYELPAVVPDDARSLAAAGLALERACGRAYGFLVASTPAGRRRWAVDALLDVALRELELGGGPRPYPGRA
jgi:hypothetical protein